MALPPPPRGLDLTEDRSVDVTCAVSISWGLAVSSVAARVLSRRLTRNKLLLDDWLIIVSLVFSGTSTLLLVVYLVNIGLGKHVWILPPDALRSLVIGLFAGEITYTLTIVFVKLSLLAFYCRIFSVHNSVKIPARILIISVITWGIAVLVVTCVQCVPLRAFWERFDPIDPMIPSEYYCGVDERRFFYGNAIPNIATDVLIIMLPLPHIWKLHLRTSQKVALTSIFALGLFLTAVSIVRFTYLLGVDLQAPDLTWTFVDNIMWTGVEGNIATLCGVARLITLAACLPLLKPIFNLILHCTVHPSWDQAARGRSGDNLNIPRLFPTMGRANHSHVPVVSEDR